jgi:hypothetical protein
MMMLRKGKGKGKVKEKERQRPCSQPHRFHLNSSV